MIKDLKFKLAKSATFTNWRNTHGLGEGLSTGSLSEIGVESERLGDGEVGWLLVQLNRLIDVYSPFMVYMGVPGRCSAEMT